MIISVPKSLNLSHNSFVSRWHTTFLNSSLVHLSCSRGFLVRLGDLLPPELLGTEDSDVEETSTGDSLPLSGSGVTTVHSKLAGSGVEVTEDAEVSTNFSKMTF